MSLIKQIGKMVNVYKYHIVLTITVLIYLLYNPTHALFTL